MALAETALNTISSVLFWVLFILFLMITTFGMLYIRKQRKFKFPCLIQFDLGSGKIGIEKTKAGWFRSKKSFFGLFDHGGERRLEVKDKRIIQQASTQDFHELNHKRGLICYAKPDDPKVLLPVKRIILTNGNLVEDIAPADFRDTSSKILDEAQREQIAGWEKFAQYAVIGVIAITALISIILIIQYSNNTMDKANVIYNEAIAFKTQTIQSIDTTPSITAP